MIFPSFYAEALWPLAPSPLYNSLVCGVCIPLHDRREKESLPLNMDSHSSVLHPLQKLNHKGQESKTFPKLTSWNEPEGRGKSFSCTHNYSQYESLLTVIIQDILQAEPEQRGFPMPDRCAALLHLWLYLLLSCFSVG